MSNECIFSNTVTNTFKTLTNPLFLFICLFIYLFLFIYFFFGVGAGGVGGAVLRRHPFSFVFRM